jgi:type I restriction enzyme, R subunit
MRTSEQPLENQLIATLAGLKHGYRPEIHDRKALEHNFCETLEALKRVRLTDGEFSRLLDEIALI